MKNNYCDLLLQEFGFNGTTEFVDSSFGYLLSKPTLMISFYIGSFSALIEGYVGLDPLVYLSFIMLLGLEFFTGIKASIREGKNINSKKFGRVILKLIIYTLLIGAVHIFKTRLEVPEFFGNQINIYSWVYYIIINLVVLQLLLSVFENLNRLGFEESSKIYNSISKLLKKWFRLVDTEDLNKGND